MRTWPVNEVTHVDKDANGDDPTLKLLVYGQAYISVQLQSTA